jgi:hypothetical protein
MNEVERIKKAYNKRKIQQKEKKILLMRCLEF